MAVIGLGIQTIGGLGLRGLAAAEARKQANDLKVTLIDRQGYQRYLRREARGALRTRIQQRLREGAKVARAEVKKSVRSVYPKRSGALWRAPAFTVGSYGLQGRGKVAAFQDGGFLGGSIVRRVGGARFTAAIFMRLKVRGLGLPGLYAPALDQGGTVRRKASRTGRAKAHTATYTARPFFDRGISASAARVYRILGRSFRSI